MQRALPVCPAFFSFRFPFRFCFRSRLLPFRAFCLPVSVLSNFLPAFLDCCPSPLFLPLLLSVPLPFRLLSLSSFRLPFSTLSSFFRLVFGLFTLFPSFPLSLSVPLLFRLPSFSSARSFELASGWLLGFSGFFQTLKTIQMKR